MTSFDNPATLLTEFAVTVATDRFSGHRLPDAVFRSFINLATCSDYQDIISYDSSPRSQLPTSLSFLLSQPTNPPLPSSSLASPGGVKSETKITMGVLIPFVMMFTFTFGLIRWRKSRQQKVQSSSNGSTSFLGDIAEFFSSKSLSCVKSQVDTRCT